MKTHTLLESSTMLSTQTEINIIIGTIVFAIIFFSRKKIVNIIKRSSKK
ncbi:hypothetical protein [Poseidonibacter ostreae]|nr:hypothetical protein [Poseidonibacter ostreae]